MVEAATSIVPTEASTPGLRAIGASGVPPHPGSGELVGWLQRAVLVASSAEAIMAGTLARLRSLGIDMRRGHMSTRILDPQYESISFTVYADGTVESVQHQHGSRLDQPFSSSPFWDLLAFAEGNLFDDGIEPDDGTEPDGARLPLFITGQRFRLGKGEGLDRYRVLEEFVAQGGTDYLTYAVAYGFEGQVEAPLTFGVVMSWLSGSPDGFSDQAVATLDAITPALAAALRMPVTLMMGDSVLSTYLGHDAAERVFEGAIRRGETETVTAAILFADLRGFTSLADRIPSADLVALLDDYLGAMADSVEAAGGQVLKFLGDGLLATFELADGDAAVTCDQALAAVTGIETACRGVNANRTTASKPALLTDIALHFGDISYGNVGSQRRLDFTVVGPAVNEAARIETLCKEIGETVLASASFVAAAGAPAAFRSVGDHVLPGVAAPRTLYALVGPG